MFDAVDRKKILGKIIKVSPQGWGFISSREIEFTRIFFHWTALKQRTLGFKELKTGMIVEFVAIEIEGKGYRAIQIEVIPNESKTEESSEMPALPERGLDAN